MRWIPSVALGLLACTTAPRPEPAPAPSLASSADCELVDGVTTPVELLRAPPPKYPDGMRNGGQMGSVRLRFVIGCDGRVRTGSIAVLNSSHTAFEKPAIESVSRSEFRPAMRGDRVVAMELTMEIRFEVVGHARRP